MRKFIVLLAALAVAVTVQTPQRAMAQTAPASKDANGTISLTAQQKKQTAAPVRAAPARTVAQPTRPTRSVAQTDAQADDARVTQPTKPIRTVTQPTKPTRTVKTGLTQGPGKVTKRNITQGPGKLTTKRVISRGPGLNKGNRTVNGLQRNRVVRSDRGNYRGWRGGPTQLRDQPRPPPHLRQQRLADLGPAHGAWHILVWRRNVLRRRLRFDAGARLQRLHRRRLPAALAGGADRRWRQRISVRGV